jgi:NitT/TauT family transport system ATP-binding protein
LLRLVASLLEPSQGQVRIQNGGVSRRVPRVAFVFQDPTLLPWRDVAANIRLPLELEGVSRSRQRALVEKSLQAISFSAEDAHKLPRMLSGGMRMRVSLARALVTQPEILLLDEPFGALDDLLREQLNEELLRLWLTSRPTTLLVTHNVYEAVFVSQRILLMRGRPGRIAAEIEVPFAYPRTASLRSDPEYLRLAAHVGATLREAA